MQPRKSPLDRRPFQSRADREREQSLEIHYRDVAIREVAAALSAGKSEETKVAAAAS